jgi:hypothetical protein
VWATHNHSKLFAELREGDRKLAGQRYAARRLSAIRGTLDDVLAFGADVFVKWRYMHEQSSVTASMGEIQRAFGALADGL